MIHKLTTATALPDHWLANLRVNCGQRLKQAEPVHLNRVGNEDEEKCAACSHVENDQAQLPFVSFWEDTRPLEERDLALAAQLNRLPICSGG